MNFYGSIRKGNSLEYLLHFRKIKHSHCRSWFSIDCLHNFAEFLPIFSWSWMAIIRPDVHKIWPDYVYGGGSSALCFLSWIKYPTSSLKIRIFGLLFNYLPTLFVVGGGLLYLLGTYGLDDANLTMRGIQGHFIGYVGLILKFGYWIPHLSRLATGQDSNTKIGIYR